MLSSEQAKQIKNQLFKQLEHLPEEQRISFEEQIGEMNEKELEEFLIKNNMIKSNGEESFNSSNECVFCLIAEDKIPSYKLNENKDYLAILEINPISRGHLIIVPKKHIESDNISAKAFSLAKKLSQKVKKILKPKKVDILSSELFGHGIINVLPIYDKEHLGSQRKKASEDELKELKTKLEIKKKEKVIKTEKKPKEEIPIFKLPKAPIRIP